jgi:PAS domain S-box-containing protein
MNMKLRTQFTSLMIIFCIIFISIGISAWYTNQQIAKINEQELIANNIIKDAYQLSYFSNDYLFHIGETRQNLQWESKYKGLADDIARLDVNNPEQQALVDQIKGNQLRLREVYTQSVATIQASQSVPGKQVDPELVQVAWSRFVVQNQGMIFDASQLSGMLHEESDQLQRTNTIITFSLMGLFLVILVILFLFFNRRVLDSISLLQEGTKIIGSGNLEHQITYQGDDEIGELSDDFNRMARNLKSVTASKADLEREIAEREKAEQSAKESLELYQTLSESAKDIIFICDPAGNLHYFNKNGAAVFGTSVDDLIGKTLEQAFPPGIAKEQRRQLDLVLESKKPLLTEINILLPNIDLWLDVQLIPIFTGRGTIKSVMGVARDITSRKKAEEELRAKNNDLEAAYEEITATEEELRQNYQELEQSQRAVRESEERFRALFEEALDGICLADAKTGIILDCNQALVDLVGRERAELIGQPQSILHPPHNDDSAYSPTFRQHIADKKGQILETQVLTKAGIIREVDIKANLLNIQGQEIIQGIFRDITERKKTQETLRESEEKYRVLFANAQVGMFRSKIDGTAILDLNEKLTEIFGHSREEMLKNPATIRWAHSEKRNEMMDQLKEKGIIADYEVEIITRDHTIRTCLVSLVINQKEGYVEGSALDITERKRAEEELKNYSGRLEVMVSERTRQLMEAQDQLVKKEKLAVLGKLAGGVGHELRNPLGAIKNAAYFLTMALETPDPDVKEMVELINKEVARSEDIISSLLDFARPKTLTLRKESVKKVVNEALKRNPVPRNVTVIDNLDETLPEIQADPDKLLQVFNNIISNAFQAMPEGGKLTITSKLSGHELVSIAFVDTGTGISAENMKKLFEPLFTTKIKGIGLGMVVTKTIVEAHGGTIDVQSVEEKGATFTVNLPISGRKAD